MSDRMAHSRPTEKLREQLSLFVLEMLGEEEAAAIERHLAAGCAVCEAELRDVREALAAVASGLAVEPPPSLRSRVLTKATEPVRQVWKQWEQLAPAAARLHIVREGEGKWETVAPGVFARRLYVDRTRDSVTMMVRMDPGASYSPHRHAGPEQCFVLQGDIHDGENWYHAGDFQCAASGSTHGVQRTENGCLLLIVSSMSDQLLA